VKSLKAARWEFSASPPGKQSYRLKLLANTEWKRAGGWIQSQFNFTPRWQLNVAYGLEAPNLSNLRTGDRFEKSDVHGKCNVQAFEKRDLCLGIPALSHEF